MGTTFFPREAGCVEMAAELCTVVVYFVSKNLCVAEPVSAQKAIILLWKKNREHIPLAAQVTTWFEVEKNQTKPT